jgi:predicted DCC family thiol-disulfide oxidoreductase YuxK
MSASPAPADPAAAACVFYDGGCPLCTREIALYQRLAEDGPSRPAFENIAQEAAALPAGVSREEALARFHVRLHSGEIVSGAAAFIALWRATPRLRWLGRIAAVPPVPWLLELGYRGFLKARPLWRKANPAAEAVSRDVAPR